MMAPKVYALLFFAFMSSLAEVYAGGNDTPAIFEAIIMFPSAPNPTSEKCLIRTYLPDNDPNASIRILYKDSTLFKEISLAGTVGICSTPLIVSDWKADTFLYQLFYHGETKMTRSFVVKH
jgi:hypothetical protein